MNTRFRDCVRGPFNLRLSPAEQITLIGVDQQVQEAWPPSWQGQLTNLARKGLISRHPRGAHLTRAGRAAVALLTEAGLYEERHGQLPEPDREPEDPPAAEGGPGQQEGNEQ